MKSIQNENLLTVLNNRSSKNKLLILIMMGELVKGRRESTNCKQKINGYEYKINSKDS